MKALYLFFLAALVLSSGCQHLRQQEGAAEEKMEDLALKITNPFLGDPSLVWFETTQYPENPGLHAYEGKHPYEIWFYFDNLNMVEVNYTPEGEYLHNGARSINLNNGLTINFNLSDLPKKVQRIENSLDRSWGGLGDVTVILYPEGEQKKDYLGKHPYEVSYDLGFSSKDSLVVQYSPEGEVISNKRISSDEVEKRISSKRAQWVDIPWPE